MEKKIYQDKTLLAIIGLLILRIPFVMGIGFLFSPYPIWALLTYEIGTYLLISILLIREKENLAIFNIDRLSIIIILVFGSIFKISFLVGFPLASAILSISFLFISILLFNRLRKFSKLIQTGPGVLRWLWKGVLITIGLSIFFGFLVDLTDSRDLAWFPANKFLLFFSLLNAFIGQFSSAVILEEPLFRGFLWGYLRSLEWNENTIWFAVSGLFWVSHLHIFTNLYSMFVITPIISLAYGYLVVRSRSIAPSMVAHAVYNAIATGIF